MIVFENASLSKLQGMNSFLLTIKQIKLQY